MAAADTQVAVVVGADPVAPALARRLRADGTRVCLVGAEPADGDADADWTLTGDPADVDLQSRAIRAVVDRWGRLDLLVVHTPELGSEPLLECDPIALQALVRGSVAAPLGWAQRAYWLAMAGGGGRVLHLATSVRTGGVALGASMLRGLTRLIAAELAPAVRVNGLTVPAGTAPELFADLAYLLSRSTVASGEVVEAGTAADQLQQVA
ncbi:hypothetical protein AB0J80_27480 [Actinoplanes sp. NPDC049548]|uniref:hypothetical protein n=1 Tax=Actinoplanes sp. NPDC049548 TaxID=3155152 RepID=UPI003445FF13